MLKKYKKKMLLIPSAYNRKVMGDVANFIEYYKEVFDLYVLYDGKSKTIDNVCYVNSKSSFALYLKLTADYIIDAGSTNGDTFVNKRQKRISVWHGIPYKKMFIDLSKSYVEQALRYNSGVDLMVSPSKFYSEEFLRKAMLYNGEILETAVSRTDGLFLNNNEKEKLKKEVGIPLNRKVLLYAPTFRQKGKFILPFNPKRLINQLNEKTGEEWVLVVKLHYLNKLITKNKVINLTNYSNVNNLLALTDLLITDYSSLMFDYSILQKPAIFYQYDKLEYEKNRGFMFDLEDYVDNQYIVQTEEELLDLVKSTDRIIGKNNLIKIKETFYPYQKPNSTKNLVKKLNLNTDKRKTKDIIFLVNELNEIGGIHNFILNLSKEFKQKYNSRIFVFGIYKFSNRNEKYHVFDQENIIDIKLSYSENSGEIRTILKHTDAIIISCQFFAHKYFQQYLSNKNSILMFHGDVKDVINKTLYKWHLNDLNEKNIYNYKKLVLLTEDNEKKLKKHLNKTIKTSYIENSYDFTNSKNYFKKNNEFVFVSRLDEDKNVFSLIDIFSSKKLNKDYTVHVYGDGPLKKEFIDKIKQLNLQDKIIYHGYCNDKDKIYKNKQGLIMTGLSEGFPMVILEAINYGIPIYLFNSYTACKEFEGLKNIKLIEELNINEYVKELNHGDAINQKEFKELKDKYSNENIANKWINLFEEIESEKQIKPSIKILLKIFIKKVIKKIKENKNKLKKNIKLIIKHLKRKLRFIIKLLRLRKIKKMFIDCIRKLSELSIILKYYCYEMKHIFDKRTNPLVSIVIPFYDKIDTIDNLLKSIEKSGYKNYEILVINDGSKQDPSNICRKYSKVKYFYKENEGLGLTRNFGINHATGKYVFFIDPDDTLCKGALRYLVDFAEKNKLSVVAGKCRRIDVKTRKVSYWRNNIYSKTYINLKANRNLLTPDMISTAKLYNLKDLRESKIIFEKGLYEDKVYTFKIYSYFEKIGIINNLVYNWLIYGENTSISTTVDFNNMKERIDRIKEIFEKATEKQKYEYYILTINNDFYYFIRDYRCYRKKEQKSLYNMFRKFFVENYKYSYKGKINSYVKRELLSCFIDNNFERFDVIADCVSFANGNR